MPPTTGKNVATIAIVVMTLVLGSAYAFEGGYLLLVAADFLPGEPGDLSERIIFALDPALAFLTFFGVLFLVFGIMALLGALGLFWQKQWGRLLIYTVAVLAMALGLCWLKVGPWIRDVDSVPLGLAQVLYGAAVLAILSINSVEPVGIHILRLLNILVGLPVALSLGSMLPEVVPDLFQREGTSGGDAGSSFLALVVLSGFVAGLLMLATGLSLLISGPKRFRMVIGLMIATASAEAAMAAFALMGASHGHSRGGLREAWLLVVFFPAAMVLLLLTVSGTWYLRRLNARRALEAHPVSSETPALLDPLQRDPRR
jgi:hypothetical protein